MTRLLELVVVVAMVGCSPPHRSGLSFDLPADLEEGVEHSTGLG
jgi:hypothetical protein